MRCVPVVFDPRTFGLHRLNKVAHELFPDLCAPTRDYGGKYSRETYLDAKISEAEQLLKRAKTKRVPVYEARLSGFAPARAGIRNARRSSRSA